MEISWTEESQSDYHRNIIYLSENWPESVVVDFIEEVQKLLKTIQIQPDLYPLINQEKVRKAVLSKHISLYYVVAPERIYLLRFWNNYQNPDLLAL